MKYSLLTSTAWVAVLENPISGQQQQ